MKYIEPDRAKKIAGWLLGGVVGSLLALRKTGWFVFCNNCGHTFTIDQAEALKKKSEEK